MALSTQLLFEVRTGGSDTLNGGAFRGGAILSAPASAPTITPSSSGGTISAGTYYVVYTYVDAQGETRPSAQTAVTLTGSTSSFIVSIPANPGNCVGYLIYIGTVSGGPYYSVLGISTCKTFANAAHSQTSNPITSNIYGPPGIDYSQQDSRQIAYTDLVIDGTTNTKITSAGNPFTQNHIGNVIAVTSGTGFTVQRLEIQQVDSSGVATVDKSAGTLGSTGGNGGLGGALASLGMASGLFTFSSGWIVFRKYNATAETFSNSASVSGGRFTTNGVTFAVVSYDTNRTLDNTDANRQEIRPSANSVVCFTLAAGGSFISNFIFTNPSNFTTVTAISMGGAAGTIKNCKIAGTFSNAITLSGTNTIVFNCEFAAVTGNCINVSGTGNVGMYCVFDTCPAPFNNSTSIFMPMIFCNFTNISTAIVHGNGIPAMYINCSFHKISTGTAAIFSISTNSTAFFVNNIFYGNGLNTGVEMVNIVADTSARGWGRYFVNNAVGNAGTAGNFDFALPADASFNTVTLTGNPFVDGPNKNVGLNSTSGAGAACKGTGYSSFPGGYTATTPDIGSAQAAGSVTTLVLPIVRKKII